MEYLSIDQIARRIPSVRLSEGLPASQYISTAGWLQRMERQGYRPFYASAGPSHSDGNRTAGERRARHLVAVVSDNGEVYAFLNGHTRMRRSWMGLGFQGQGAHSGRFLIVASVPVARADGPDEAVDLLAGHRRGMRDIMRQASAEAATPGAVLAMARQVCATAYLPACSKPDPAVLAEAVLTEGMSLRRAAMAMVDRVMSGGLPPLGAIRRLKPIASADGAMLACSSTGRALFARFTDIGEWPMFIGRA